MQTKSKDILTLTVQEAFPEFYNFLEGIQLVANRINKILEPVRYFSETFFNSPQFKKFIEGCKYQLVIFKAEEQYWAINDKTLIKQLQLVAEESYSETITNYYVKNNYEKIIELNKSWETIDCIAERLPIFTSCLNIMKTDSQDEDIFTVVIPTLTAQITGITEDLCSLVPENEKKKIKEELRKGQNNPSKGEITTEYLWRMKQKEEVFYCSNIIFNAVMKNTRSEDSYTEEELEKYNKYRNKILHGDKQFLNYGTKENLVRSWLELNILIKVYSMYKNYKTKELDNE